MSGYKELYSMPPPYSDEGRHQGYPSPGPPPGPPPVSSYAPAPPVLQQQISNTNVVVVGQPSAPQPSTVTVQPIARASEYLGLTVVLMVLCFLHGNLPAFICLVPALIGACVASDHNNAGNYESAKSCGNFALCCNVLALVKYFLIILAIVASVVIYFTIGFGFITGGENPTIPSIHIPTIPSIHIPTIPSIHIPTCGYRQENCHFDSNFNYVCDNVYVCE